MKHSRQWISLALVISTPFLPACGKKSTSDEPAAGSTEEAPAYASATAAPAASARPAEETYEIDDATRAAIASADAAALRGETDSVQYEAWFKKHGLDLTDPGMLDQDPDKDGYSNRDEFLADTDPNDSASRPGLHATLRMAEYHETQLPVLLENVSGGSATLRRTADGGSATEKVKAGDEISGTPFKVVKVTSARDTDKEGQAIDISRLTLQNKDTGEKVFLIKDMPARSSESYAVLKLSTGGDSIKVHQGEKFSMPDDPNRTYQVLDIRPTQIVVKEEGSGHVWTIPKQ